MAETIPMVQEAENFSAENSKDTIVSLENHDENIPNIVRITKKRELIKRFTVEKRRSTISVFIITGISILLLTTIIICIIIETINARNRSNFRHRKKWISHSEEDKRYHLSLVAQINKLNTTWKAVYNRFASRASILKLSLFEKNKLLSKLKREYPIADSIEHIKLLKSKKLHLPEQFDARLRWPQCWSIHQVANQGECGSCWAVSAVSVMSDRLCIATNYSNQKQISAEDLISCCAECGGCQGTEWALFAFIYWRDHGIVTGGDYGSFEGCKPYTFASDCGTPCTPEDYRKKIAPTCQKICQPLYGHSYKQDLISSRKAYLIRIEKFISGFAPTVKRKLKEAIGNEDPVELIKREIYLYGPTLACFAASEDLQHYDSGIYHPINHSISSKIYGHCVKMLGWGEENNQKYWLYMNTWGRHWGEYGFFRASQSELPEDVIGGSL